MPIFEIEFQGKAFEVDAPDQAAALAAMDSMKPEAETTLAGVGKAAWTGLREGGAGLAGLPADAIDLLGRMTGKGEQTAQFAKDYGSAAMLDRVKGATGEMYQPQTGIEKTAQSVGNFLPGVIGGGASIPVKLATRVALPAAASEGAKALTEGTAAEPYAGIAGALGGLAGGMGLERALARPKGIAPVPTKAELDTAKDIGYKTPALQAAEYKPAAVGQFADTLVSKLKQSRISEKQAPKTYDAIEGLRAPAFKANHTAQDLDETRRLLNKIAGNFADPVEAGVAQRAVNAIDAFMLRPPKGAAIDDAIARQAGKDLFKARANAAAGFRSERMTEALERAMDTAGATHSGGNTQNEIQKAARTILNNRKLRRGFNEQEVAALREIARGTMGSNLLRRVGKVFGGGGGLGQLASGAAGGSMFGFPGMVALPAIGMGANKIGSMATQRKWSNLDELVRSRSPQYGAANQAAFMGSLQGPGILGRLPSPGQASLYTALMTQRPQPVQ
jgi:hypothetical protein